MYDLFLRLHSCTYVFSHVISYLKVTSFYAATKSIILKTLVRFSQCSRKHFRISTADILIIQILISKSPFVVQVPKPARVSSERIARHLDANVSLLLLSKYTLKTIQRLKFDISQERVLIMLVCNALIFDRTDGYVSSVLSKLKLTKDNLTHIFQ